MVSDFDMRSNWRERDDFSIAVRRSVVRISDSISRARLFAALRAAYSDAVCAVFLIESVSFSR